MRWVAVGVAVVAGWALAAAYLWGALLLYPLVAGLCVLGLGAAVVVGVWGAIHR